MTDLATVTPAQLDKLDAAARATLFTDARTANTFAPTPVADHELSDIWDLAKWAPTSANTQPLRILYVRPGNGRDRLVQHMNEETEPRPRERLPSPFLLCTRNSTSTSPLCCHSGPS